MLRVHVAALGPRPILRVVDAPGPPPPSIAAEVLLVCVPRYADVADLDRLVHELPGTARANAEAIVLRAHPREAGHLLPRNDGEASDAAELLRLRSRAPVLLLHWADGAHRLTPLAGDDGGLGPDDADPLIRQLRHAELAAYAAEPGVALPANDAFHYIGPNGKHYRSFLRVGSALQAPDHLDGAAFWLLPHVGPDTAIVVDSSTISVIGLHLGQYLREQALDHASVSLVQPMRGYDTRASDDMLARLTAAVPDPSARQRALLLVSTVSTGGLARRGRARLRDNLQYDEVLTIALYGPEDRPDLAPVDDVLCRLPADLDRSEPGDCAPCKPTARYASPALTIAPDTYTLGVAQATASTSLDLPQAAPGASLVTRYDSTGAFHVHRDEPSGRPGTRARHHAIYVDIQRLLDSPDFTAAVQDKADSLAGHVDGLLAPHHNAAIRLAEIVGQRLGLEPVIRDPDELRGMPDTERDRLDVNRLLLVDDAVITGDRLRSFRLALLDQKLHVDQLHLFVALSRLRSATDRVAVQQSVHQMSSQEVTFHAVEELLLPHWEGDECPWCWERDRLADHGRDNAHRVSERLIQRYQTLDQTDVGLQGDLFWGLDSQEFPLGPNSVFGPYDVSQAGMFTAVASGIQQLRSEGKLDEQFMPPVSKVLAPEFWEIARYYASPITAAILRACRPHDLVSPRPGKKIIDTTDARFVEDASRNLRLELLLALAARKLPTTASAALALLDVGMADEGLHSLFEQLLPHLAD